MGIIRVLPEHIANKIAAGEVVERPSSIVKELLENALDAGATAIEVEINHGGRSFIRVADNGCGMNAEDAELAFKRHATSKITDISDLDAIASYGFRGEALPSIAAVSRVKLVTRPAKANAATEIAIEGGHILHVKEAPAAPGTSVEIRDLFFNTPARRKFIKTDSTEMGHVMDVVQNFALSYPSLRVQFKSSGKTIWDLSPASDFMARAEKVLGGDTAKHLLRLDAEVPGIKIHGFIGKPYVARANRSGQSFFVNRRWVRSIGLSHALQAGYHGLLMHGQFPAAVLFLELDPAKVDVNVHPTKQEVRLSHESEVKSLIKKVVAERLIEEGDISPELRPFKEPVSGEIPAGLPAFSGKSDPVSLYKSELGTILEVGEPAVMSGAPAAKARPAEPEPMISIRNQLKITKILGQVHATFIVTETEEGFMVIDQHAAHERVMFEALLKNFDGAGPVARQNFLMDEILELHPRQVEVLQSSLPLLRKVGFEIEEFGERAFVVRSYPAILEKEDPLAFLKAYVEEREDGQVKTRLEEHREDVAALIACKRQSVKAHDALTSVQLQALLERLAQCENPFSCPHGRPTFFKKTFSELERQFKRK